MKKRGRKPVTFCLVILAALLAGCADKSQKKSVSDMSSSESMSSSDLQDLSENLMEPYSSCVQPINTWIMTEKAQDYNAVALDFFKKSVQRENMVISPIGIVNSMAVILNGAAGTTLAEMERGFKISYSNLNEYLNTFINQNINSGSGKFHMYNSLWLNKAKDFEMQESLQQLNADIFHDDIFMVEFNQKAVENINTWAYTESTAIIDSMLDSYDKDDSLYLMNLSYFNGKWKEEYGKNQIKENRSFTTIDGDVVPVKMLHSHEHKYLNVGKAKGFIKYYHNREYAFVGLLPNEGTDLMDYVQSMQPEDLQHLLTNCMNIDVVVEIPMFQAQYDLDLKSLLKRQGIIYAFDEEHADLSNFAISKSGHNLFVSEALNKSYFAVNERGTQGATISDGKDQCGKMVVDGLKKEVILDRPFMYMVVDTRYQIPVLMGIVTDIRS